MKKELSIKQIYDDFISKVILTEQEEEVQMIRETAQRIAQM